MTKAQRLAASLRRRQGSNLAARWPIVPGVRCPLALAVEIRRLRRRVEVFVARGRRVN